MNSTPVWLWLCIGLTVLALLTVGVWFYFTEKSQFQREIETTLLVTNKLKASQISTWRAERLAEAGEIMERPFLSEWMASCVKDPQSERDEAVSP
ncbi:MAG: hypothetical protein IPI28_06430 [Candidatus Omnitrophica bacterium]|nr:hypothetical protein [Candidatus Omnitrophota bacterium]